LHRFSTATLVVVIVASLLMPLGISQASDEGIRSTPNSGVAVPIGGHADLRSVEFDDPIDTSASLKEYPLISRALMLPGGSTDAALADVNGDGRLDFVVAVGGSTGFISVFYGQDEGDFLTYPSYNISLGRIPIALTTLDVKGIGQDQIAVLEKARSESDSDRLVVLNLTSDETHEELRNLTVYESPTSIVSGNFVGDAHPDIAIACSGPNPMSTPGVVEVREGPSFSTYSAFVTGNGSNAIVAGNLNGDSLTDLAIGNYHDSVVTVFHQPFSLGMSPSTILEIDGSPTTIAAGRLNGDGSDDLAVCTEESSSVRFFFQSLGALPLTEDYNRSLQHSPSDLTVDDLNGDGLDDLLILSADANVALCMYQRAISPIWGTSADAIFPTGAYPRKSLIGYLDSDSNIDIAIASARDDWSGSSIAVYLAGPDNFSNSNMTVWTSANYEATAMASGDINGDDHEDLVLLYPDSNAFSYHLSYSGSIMTIGLAYEPLKLIVGDLDVDGFCDVLTTESGGDEFTIHIGDGTGPDSGLFDTWTCQCSGNITDIAVGDVSDDGLPDVVVATDKGTIDVFVNPGHGSMYDDSYEIEVLPGGSLTSIAIGDFDSDGLNDIAYPRPTRTISIILQQDGSPLSMPESFNLTASFVGEFETALCGDITGDGRDDIVGLRSDDPMAYLFDQMSFGTTSLPFDTLAFPEAPSFVALLDATDDGFKDVIAMFNSADLVFLYGQENGLLPKTPSMTFVAGASPTLAMVADGSQDHRGDLVVCDSASHSVSVWEQVNSAPVAHSGGPYVTQQGDPLTFNGSATTGASEIPFMEYRWDFGDGNYTDWIREPNPIHTYMEIDMFDVVMEVRDPLGLSDVAYTGVTVVDSSPHVSLTLSPSIPREGELITFNDTTTSYDDIVLLNWTIDDVLISSGMENSITAVFDDGPHSITLEATDDDGSISDYTCEFQVLSMSPDATLIAPSTAYEGVSVSFEVEVDPWNDGPWDPIVSYEWNFSYQGGEWVADLVTTTNSTTMVFGAEGSSEEHSVAVLVTDDDDDFALCVVNLTILDIGPDASLVLSDDVPGEGVPFTFIAVDSFDGVIDWSWTLTGPDSYSESFNLTADAMVETEFVLADGAYHMLLEMAEADGDTDQFLLDFNVAELPPSVTLSALPESGIYLEFDEVELMTSVESYDAVAGYEWDFIAYGGEFVADDYSDDGTMYHIYNWAGNYTAKVRVIDCEGSSAIAFTTVEVVDRDLTGTFDEVIVTRKDPNETSTLVFDAGHFAEAFPDISNVVWEFGDGVREVLVGAPSEPVEHSYVPIRDYQANLTLTDDDGNVLCMSRQLRLFEPEIEIKSPTGNMVITPGTPLRFSISDDSLPLVSVMYSVNGDEERNFTILYEIDTTDWLDGAYLVVVRAEDRDGNIAVKNDIEIVIDSENPRVILLWLSNKTYAGDRINVTIEVDDVNVDSQGVTLIVLFPGRSSPVYLLMLSYGEDKFYAVADVPMRTGTIEFWFTIEDLAGNTATTEIYTATVKMHFIDAAWPYLLALALLTAIGTAAYFVRETKTAVDETFVIYHDGRLMAHSTRRLKPGMDDQVLGSMFVAVQDFVKDSFKGETSFTLRKLDFGEKSVLIEKGEKVFLAAVLHGMASKKAVGRMKMVVDEIEKSFGEPLTDWDGDLDSVRGVNDIMKKLYSRAPAFPGTLK